MIIRVGHLLLLPGYTSNKSQIGWASQYKETVLDY